MEQAGNTLRRSAPGSTLTAAVMTAVTLGAPGGAAAAGLSFGYMVAGSGSLAKSLALGSGALAGGLIGVAGFRTGLKKAGRRIRNDRDRKRLRTFGLVVTLYILLAAAAIPVGYTIWHQPEFIVTWYVVYVGGMMAMIFGWYPSILKDSLEAERAEDPTAASRQRREFYTGLTAAAAGALIGAIPVVWAVLRG